MKFTKITASLAITAAALLITGCTRLRAPFQPPVGNVYTNYTAPLGVELTDTKIGPKTGEAKTTSILGLVAFGDASIQAAAKNGGLKKVYHADYKYFNILGIIKETTVIVNGE